ncbi:hypothetical protein Taro_056892, partial [Colocasia esculenta]|nr:hypothetical protein [Colocasia esculenta]
CSVHSRLFSMAAAIATGIIADSGVVDVMKDYIFSRAKEEFKSVWYLKDEINGISDLVETIKRVDEDAEKKQLQDKDVRKWVSDRKNAGYDMEDVLCDYRVMVSTEDGQGVVTQWMRLAKDGLYLVCGIALSCLDIIPAPVTPRIEIAHRLRSIHKNLDGIKQREARLSLVQHWGGGSNESDATTSRETSSLEDKQRPMIGRNELKTEIKEALLNSSRASTSQLSIVCIVGVGGMGKTTLAQNIFNDEDVKAAFSLKEWLYVGDKFDCQGLLNKVIGNSGQPRDLNDLHLNVAEKIKKESFLIVLDDAWLTNGEEWGRFLKPLSQGDKGGAIIVTSRNSAVGTAIPYGNTLYPLPRMSDTQCMAIFERCAFKGQKAETYPDLKHLSEQVVRMLKGVPLAASIVGGFLGKHLHDRHPWIKVVEEGWPHADVVDGVVGLSYLHLPSHLKPCFAYCAMFPKGFEFNKETMVRMWIAQGYVQKRDENELMEHIGSDYFNELRQRSFLQSGPRKRYGDYYIMHDLIHDFAVKVFTEGLQVGASDTEDGVSPEEIRHLSVYCDETEPQELKILDNFKKLRTLMLESDVTTAAPPLDVLAKFKYLRLLVLRVLEGLFPPSHLMVLRIKKNRGAKLPSWMQEHRCPISSSLVVLELDGCCKLECLPTLGQFPSLKYLRIRGASSVKKIGPEFYGGTGEGSGGYFPRLEILELEEMSEWEEWEMPTGEINSGGGGGGRHMFPSLKNLCIKKCPKLLTLSPVLRHLTNLREFVVCDCPKLASFSAVLRHLTALEFLKVGRCDQLVLDGGVAEGDAEEATISSVQQPVVDSQVEEENVINNVVEIREVVVEGQSPSPYLNKSLTLKNTRGAQLPRWTKNKHHRLLPSSLVTLVLDGYCNWECLPTTLGQLPSLEDLTIEADHVKKIGPEFYGETDAGVYFPRLEYLSFENMSAWEEWEMPAGEMDGGRRHLFPSLKDLWIYKCPKLPSLSPVLRHLTSLVRIRISGCDELALLLEEEGDGECGWMFPSLEELSIEECPKLASLSPILRHSTNLKRIEINKCAELAVLLKAEGDSECGWLFPCLERLTICDCSPKLLLSQMLPHLTALKELHIGGFRNLQGLPPCLHNLRSLRFLKMEDCPAMECLPDGGLPPSLERLSICGCPLLEERCREGGPDRPKIPTTTRVLMW